MGRKYPEAGALVVAANAISVAIAEDLNIEEQNIMGNLFALVGASLLSMAAINEANQKSGTASGSSQSTASGSSQSTASGSSQSTAAEATPAG